jgi:hypothetical protein
MSDPESIDPREIQPGPIRHESLPAELLEQIQTIYDVLGPYFQMTLEEFETGFRQDADPETEVDLWMGITAVWIDYHEEYLDDIAMSAADEKRLLASLIAISTGIDDPARLGVPEKIGQRLLDCYARFESEFDEDEDVE